MPKTSLPYAAARIEKLNCINLCVNISPCIHYLKLMNQKFHSNLGFEATPTRKTNGVAPINNNWIRKLKMYTSYIKIQTYNFSK